MRAVFAVAVLFAGASAAQELRIVSPALRQYDGGPVMTAGQTLGPGETVFFSFRVGGFKVSPESRVDLHWSIDVLDSDGVKLVETMEKDIRTDLSAEDKEWMPIVRQSFMIPPIVLPGQYKLIAKVNDRLAAKDAAEEITLTVRGRTVEPSDKLVARNFRFVHSEEDPVAMREPVFRQGDTVWARFEMTGYKFGDSNRIDVSYNIAIANSEGKVLFEQPGTATEQRESFYPQKYVPGVVSVTTQKNTPAGEYFLVLRLKDAVGNQTAEERHAFRLE